MVLKRVAFVLFLIIVFSSSSLALDGDHIISNSEDWKDVFSTVHYANLKDEQGHFLVSTAHGTLLLNQIKKNNNIGIVTSEDRPLVFNYPGTIRAEGYEGVEEKEVDSANLELIEELEDINNFIVVGNSYGYPATAVTPFALKTDSWVFLADRTNIAEIDAILSRRDVNNLILYGYMDREVRETLSKYDPEVINTGNRFKNNVEIVKKYREIDPVRQVVLSNGEFIEQEVMNEREPVLFTGKENVPDPIKEYLKNSGIEIGVLVGNSLIGAASNVRESTGISVMVKFARGARSQQQGVSTVEGLDLFYVPSPSLDLSIDSIRYNRASSRLEVTYESNSNVPAYLKGTISLISPDGEQRLGDEDPVFIAPNDFKTISYSDIDVGTEELMAQIYTLYGETPAALDRVLEKTVNITIVDIIDGCEIEVKSITYNKQKEKFYVEVRNTVDNTDCWTDIELRDIVVDGREQTIGTEGSTKIGADKSKEVVIDQRMAENDIEENQFVNLRAYYGERKNSLTKLFKGRFKLSIETLTFISYAIISLSAIILILVIIIILIKRSEEDERF